MDADNNDQALKFLRELEKTLNRELPGPAEMESWIRSKVAAAKTDDKLKHLRNPEAAFLNGQALPKLFEVLTRGGLSPEQAQKALLSESPHPMPDISLRSPIRWERHPFRKILASKSSEIYQGWKNPEKGPALMRSCPDFSLRDPFPHSILFEGKYFPRGSLEFAQRQLVTNIYQAFFYRGLPPLAAAKSHPDWSYDYACLMAYDASPEGTLAAAWTDLPPETRGSFWKGANVYVMILRPQCQEQ